MEEEGGEEGTGNEKREKKNQKQVLKQDPPDHIAHCADCDVDQSEILTEADSVVFTAAASTTNIMSGESKEGNRGEDNEGGMSVEDLQRGFIKEVQSGEEREEELGKK